MNDFEKKTFARWLLEKTRDIEIDFVIMHKKTGIDRFVFGALLDARITPEQIKDEVLEKLYDFIGERYVEVKPAIAAEKGRKRSRDSEKLTEDDLFQAVK